MATPPRNDQRDRHTAASPNKGKRWALYLGVAVLVLLILFVLLGDVFTTEPALDEDAAETTAPTTTDPETTEGQTETADPAAPADDGQEDDEEVIDIEGDADVEVEDDEP